MRFPARMDDITPETLLELGELPVADDAAMLERARTLIRCGYARRMWLLLLDDDDLQLPLLPQIDGIPRSPGADAAMTLHSVLEQLAGYGSQVAVVLERPGAAEPEPDDLAWADAIRRGSHGSGVRMRGVLLAHSGGVDALQPADRDAA